MLTIPSAVEDALKNGAQKNFRVHFPNGERADITNDNIVSESVSFTESICSQSELKFGLAEASVLEFETVGVENIRGAEIEASVEVTYDDDDIVSMPYEDASGTTRNGVTFTVNADGSITANGTATQESYFILGTFLVVAEQEYKVRGLPGSGSNNTFYIGLTYYQRSTSVYENNTVVIPPDTGVSCYITVYIARGFTADNLTFKPEMFRINKTYSIPYGKFVIDECKRQTNLEHRKITAYSTSALNNDTWNEIELFRRGCVTKSSDDYLYDAVTNSVFQFVPTERVDGFTYVRINNPGTITVYLGQVILRLPDRIIDATMQFICHYVYGETANHAEFPDLKYTLEELRQQMRDVGFSEKDISRIITDDLGKAIYGECVMEFGVPRLSTTKDRFVYTSRKNIGSCDVGTFQDSTKFLAYIVPWRLQFGPLGEEFKVDLRDWVNFYDVDTPNSFSSYVHLKKTKIGTNKYVCNTREEHTPSEYLKSYLEANFLFGNYARNNQFRLVSLGDKFSSEHYQMQKSNYSQIWYDERPTLPYGIFRFGYTDSNDDEQLFEHRRKKEYYIGSLVDEEDVTASTNYVNLTINTSVEQRTSAEELIVSVPGIITEIYFYGFDTYMYENRDLPSGQSELIVKASDFVNVYGDAFTDFLEAVTVDIYYTPNDSGTVSVNEVNWQYYSESDSLTYDFTGNLILQKDSFWLENHFNSLEDSLKGIVFYPTDISSVGLPFIEAGDVIDIETDGGTITTFAEKRTISGIQALFDDIAAEASSDTYISGSDYSTGSSGGGGGSVVVNDARITITQGNFTDSFTLNQPGDKTINLPASSGGGGGTTTLESLWTNSSPSSSFTAKTVSLDLQNYDFLIIGIRFTTSTDNYANVIVKTDGTSVIEAFLASSNRYRRSISANSTGITFGGGEKASPSATSYSSDNTCYIPIYVYGFHKITGANNFIDLVGNISNDTATITDSTIGSATDFQFFTDSPGQAPTGVNVSGNTMTISFNNTTATQVKVRCWL